MDKQLFLEDLMTKIEDIATAIEEREEQGEDLSIAHDLVDELRDELQFRLE